MNSIDSIPKTVADFSAYLDIVMKRLGEFKGINKLTLYEEVIKAFTYDYKSITLKQLDDFAQKKVNEKLNAQRKAYNKKTKTSTSNKVAMQTKDDGFDDDDFM